MKAKNLIVALVAGVAVLSIGEASAVSLLTAGDVTAIGAGWTDLKDTTLALISSSWTPMLGLSAIVIAPMVVKRMFKTAVK